MNTSLLFFVLLCLTLFSYWFGVQRSLKVAGGVEHKKELTSLPQQFGLLTAMVCGLPALIALLIFNSGEQLVVEQFLKATLPQNVQALSSVDLGLYLNNIRSIANSELSSEILQKINLNSDINTQTQYQAAHTLQTLNQQATWLKTALVLIISCVSVGLLIRKFSLTYQARQKLSLIHI